MLLSDKNQRFDILVNFDQFKVMFDTNKTISNIYTF